MRQVTVDVFKFAELSDSAKEKAREWYRRGWEFNDEFVIEYATRVASTLGISLAPKGIQYSVGGSQGDGASVTGSYTFVKGVNKAIKEHVPSMRLLIRIAAQLTEIQKRNGYKLEAGFSAGNGAYGHLHTRVSGCYRSDDKDATADAHDQVETAIKLFASWIHQQLQNEYDYQQADAQVDELIEANDYEFEANGSFFG